MKTYKLAWEIQVEAENPLEAAKEGLAIMQDENSTATAFYVQAEDEKEIVSVDLSEDDDDAVLPVHCYHPLIESIL